MKNTHKLCTAMPGPKQIKLLCNKTSKENIHTKRSLLTTRRGRDNQRFLTWRAGAPVLKSGFWLAEVSELMLLWVPNCALLLGLFCFICHYKWLHIIAITSLKVMPDANVLWRSHQELKKISLKLLTISKLEGLISQSFRYEEWAFSQVRRVWRHVS